MSDPFQSRDESKPLDIVLVGFFSINLSNSCIALEQKDR